MPKNKLANKKAKQQKLKLGLAAPTFKPPHRERRKPKYLQQEGIDDADLLEADPDIDALVVPEVYDEDFDWLPNVPGRPAPFTTTWNVVYGHRTWSPPNFIIGCQEGCGQDITLNGKLQEIGGGSTPHGQLRKPPVCHNVSWAALEVSMLNMQSQQASLTGKPAQLRSDFIRAVCWEPSNLRPGHNACNALGTKTTAQNVTQQELNAAAFVVDKVKNAWFGSIWAF